MLGLLIALIIGAAIIVGIALGAGIGFVILISVLLPPIIMFGLSIGFTPVLSKINPTLSVIPYVISTLLTIGYFTDNGVWNCNEQAACTINTMTQAHSGKDAYTMCKDGWHTSSEEGVECPCQKSSDCHEDNGQACVKMWDRTEKDRELPKTMCMDNEYIKNIQLKKPHIQFEVRD